jgi:Hemerythrin HHE cation binding domain
MDITQLILDDHHEQRLLFSILEQIDRTDTASLSAVWTRLAAFLELHAEAEEELFYPELLRAVERDIEQANDQDEDVPGRPDGSLGIGKLKGL